MKKKISKRKMRREWALALLFLPMIAHAQTPYDRLFKTGTLNDLQAGDQIEYDLVSEGLGNAAADDRSRVRLDIKPDNVIEIRRIQGEQQQFLGTFPQDVGNPMNMYFFERLTDIVAEETGGSPFYIRNDFKEALVVPINPELQCSGAFEARDNCIVMLPFVDDPNRDKLARFADLQIQAVLSEEDPAWLVGMQAVVPDDAGGFLYKLEKMEAANE